MRTRSAMPTPIAARSTASPRRRRTDSRSSPGISVKLTALHPRYEWSHADEAVAAVLPVVRELALKAAKADVHFTIDAEEADRLELQLDVFEALLADDELFADGWGGFGIAVQAYQKRAVPLCRMVAEAARAHGRKLMVRLVKGAYWDTEVKAAQVAGLPDYPVFTRKVATDVSYLACAKALFDAGELIYPAFATHNANTIGQVKALAKGRPFEFQRLHGMGEALYEELAQARGRDRRRGGRRCGSTPRSEAIRSCSPTSSGGCSRTAPIRASSTASPTSRCRSTSWSATRSPSSRRCKPKRNPKIVLPREIFGAERRNSAGVDLSDPLVREPLMQRLKGLESRIWTAKPTLGKGKARAINSPHDRRIKVGTVAEASAADVDRMVRAGHDAQLDWDALGGEARARLLDRTADLYEEHREELFSLCIREGGKTLPDAVLEVREAVDFLRFYAAEARRQFARPMPLPGPTGEQNELRLHGRGVFASISPWNFPLAIFTGLVSAPLAAGNAVVAKPAGQTPLIAALRGRADAPGGHPQGHRPARARRGQGRGRNADRSPAAPRRRVHRLDRHRANDQPHAGRARRADHSVRRRDRRPECDDRRFSRPCPSRSPATSSPRPSRAPASAARRCACCSSRRTWPIR